MPKNETKVHAEHATGHGHGRAAALDAVTDEPRHAMGVTPELQAKSVARLKRIEGQVRGVQRMVEEGRYCADILVQISAIHEALRGVGKLLMRNHLEHCVTEALRSEDPVEAEKTYGEVLDLMYRHAR